MFGNLRPVPHTCLVRLIHGVLVKYTDYQAFTRGNSDSVGAIKIQNLCHRFHCFLT